MDFDFMNNENFKNISPESGSDFDADARHEKIGQAMHKGPAKQDRGSVC